jgi:hypothetical protein
MSRRTDLAPKVALLTVGLLVVVLFALPEVKAPELDGIKLADFAKPRLVLAMAMLASLCILFQTLYRHLCQARVRGEGISLVIDFLGRKLVGRSKALRNTDADIMEFGVLATGLTWVTDGLVDALQAALLTALGVGVVWQLKEVFTPVIADALTGSKEMLLVTALAAGLAVAAVLRAMSCLVVACAPRRNRREQIRRLMYPVRRLIYPKVWREERSIAEEALDRARRVLQDSRAKAEFDESFNSQWMDIKVFGSGFLWGNEADISPGKWTEVQRWTFIRIMSAYSAEYLALSKTIGLGPLAVDVLPESNVESDALCMTMIENARQVREPRYSDKLGIPEPVYRLLKDGTIVSKKELDAD